MDRPGSRQNLNSADELGDRYASGVVPGGRSRCRGPRRRAFPMFAVAGVRPDGRYKAEAPAIENTPSIFLDSLNFLSAPSGRHRIGCDLLNVETVATADEFLQGPYKVCLVLGLDERVVVVDKSLGVIERDSYDRIADDVL